MTEYNPENFFDNTGGGAGAPSALLKSVDDFVHGEIVDQFMVDATDFSTKEVKKDKKTGKVIQQLVIVLQTTSRNWDKVVKVPLVDKDDRSSAPKPVEEDDGRRNVYVEPWTNIHAAVGAAVVAATGAKGPVRNGGTLGVKVVELRDTGKGNPLKVHQAVYTPPAAQPASDAFFDQTAADTAKPVEAPAAPAPAATPAAAPASDPWGTPAADATKPPF